MFKNKSIYTLLLLIVFTIANYAQVSEKATVVLGGAALFPVGSFGNDRYGNGETGYGLFAETYLKATSTIRVNVTFLYGLNPLSETTITIVRYVMNYKRKNMELKWLMAGVGTEFQINENCNYFIIPQIGILFSEYPETDYNDNGRKVTLPDIEQSSFAYGLNAGVMIKPIVIGVKYYFSKPVFETTLMHNFLQKTEAEDIKFNVSSLNLYIGFAF